MTAPELLGCPFCGALPTVDIFLVGDEDEAVESFAVGCDCSCPGKSFDRGVWVASYSQDTAISAWNTRTRLAAVRDLVKAGTRVLATKDEYDKWLRTEMPARALLPVPDRAAGNKAFDDLRTALANATSQEGEKG